MSAAHIYADYEEMLRSFRCQDLANLLTYTGQSRNGKKAELLDRCLSILKRGNVSVQLKIKEIYNNRMTVTPGSNYLLNAASSCSSTSNSPGKLLFFFMLGVFRKHQIDLFVHFND